MKVNFNNSYFCDLKTIEYNPDNTIDINTEVTCYNNDGTKYGTVQVTFFNVEKKKGNILIAKGRRK